MQKPIQFKNNKGHTLRGFIHLPKKYDTAVIFLHGFPGHTKGKTSTRIGRDLGKKYLVLRFDFSGTETSEGKFEDKLISQEVKDIKSAIQFLEKVYEFKKIILVGHSTGGINTALYAHKDKRVSKIVLMGATSNLDEGVRYEWSDRQIRDFWLKGHCTYNHKGEWYYKKKLRKRYYDEFFTLDVLKSLKKFRKSVLIIHGSKDEALPAEKDPKELYAAANKPKKLVIIKNADHQFLKPAHWKQVIRQIDRFIRKN